MATAAHEQNGRPSVAAPAIMIRQVAIAADDPNDRVWRRQVPAWMMSGGIHLTLMALFLIYAYFVPNSMPASPLENQLFETKVDDLAAKQNFENSDVGLNPDQQTNYNLDRLENVSVPGPVKPEEPVGIVGAPEGPPQTIPPPPGFGGGQGGGIDSDKAGAAQMFGKDGGWMGGRSLPGVAFAGRSGATRQKMLAEGGGNAASEAAVTKGLQWLVRQQKNDGRWALTDATAADDIAATGLGLLPFLAAGQTHKPAKGEKESPYSRTVEFGLSYLKSKQRVNGSFNGARDMYGHAIATMALCEAFGMTQDPSLKKVAQSAIDYLAKAQHPIGGFRYVPGMAGDTSVTGWCLQALKSGQMAGLSVDRQVIYKVGEYLDSVQTQNGAAYGYTGPGATRTMTSVGLLCRYYLGWGPKNPNFAAGVELLKKNLPIRGLDDIYYYYYATQVMHFFGGDDWDKLWNPKMRDLLVDSQDNSASKEKNGSWTPDNFLTGKAGGRLAATSLSLLTLEVYYRHLPLYQRENSGLRDIE
jgi:prenyltransferase beta subunit